MNDTYDSLGFFQEITHKITLHTTLIRDQIGQGLGFSIAGGKGSPPFKDGTDGIYISRVTEGGLAQRDGKILVGDRVLVVSSSYKESKIRNILNSIKPFYALSPDKRR